MAEGIRPHSYYCEMFTSDNEAESWLDGMIDDHLRVELRAYRVLPTTEGVAIHICMEAWD
jgi:hypothetical protein